MDGALADNIPNDQEQAPAQDPGNGHMNLPDIGTNMDYMAFDQQDLQYGFNPTAETVPADLDFGAWMDFLLDPGTRTMNFDRFNMLMAFPDFNNNGGTLNDLGTADPGLAIPQSQSGQNQTTPALGSEEPFSLPQIDPLEFKCVEMRNLLKESAANDLVAKFIARDNLVKCIGLCGKHFLPNIPILHLATFHITETPSILLLAMMLVGACYSENIIPGPKLYDLAMRLLVIVNNQPVCSLAWCLHVVALLMRPLLARNQHGGPSAIRDPSECDAMLHACVLKR